MRPAFWTAIWAWSACFVLTIVISLATRQQRSDEELTGLVYALTPKQPQAHLPWWQTPEGLGVAVIAAVAVLNVIFW